MKLPITQEHIDAAIKRIAERKQESKEMRIKDRSARKVKKQKKQKPWGRKSPWYKAWKERQEELERMDRSIAKDS